MRKVPTLSHPDCAAGDARESFRPRRSFLLQGAVLTPAFVALTIAAAVWLTLALTASSPPPGDAPNLWMLGLAVLVFAGMSLLGLYLLVASVLEQVTIEGTRIVVRTVFQRRALRAADVERLVWKARRPWGGVELCLAGRRTRIDFGAYPAEDRLRMIRLLYRLVPEEKQVQWPLFCQKVALPLRRRLSIVTGGTGCDTCEPGEILVTRRRFDRAVALLLPVSASAALVLWHVTQLIQVLALPLAVTVAWLLLRYSVPREGAVQVRASAAHIRPRLKRYLAMLAAAVLLLVVLPWCGVARSTAVMTSMVPLVLLWLDCLYGTYRYQVRQDRDERAASHSAAERWTRGEQQIAAG